MYLQRPQVKPITRGFQSAEGFFTPEIKGETHSFGRIKSSMVGIFSSFPTVEEGKQKGPKEMQESPWGLHMGTLWKLPFMTCSRRLGVSLKDTERSEKKSVNRKLAEKKAPVFSYGGKISTYR
jgi:hypothetical protein